MQKNRKIAALNDRELQDCTPPTASWHRDYHDTAFIFIGGLDERLNEGDIIQVFSQYGQPVFLNLVRDKESGRSKGYGWLKYADQRSCDLAVDNLSGAELLRGPPGSKTGGRLIAVDHAHYQKRDNEDLSDNTRGPGTAVELARIEGEQEDDTEIESDADAVDSTDEEAYSKPPPVLLKEEVELKRLVQMDDEDPMKEYLIEKKKEELQTVLSKQKKSDKKRRNTQKSERKSKRRLEEKSNRCSDEDL